MWTAHEIRPANPPGFSWKFDFTPGVPEYILLYNRRVLGVRARDFKINGNSIVYVYTRIHVRVGRKTRKTPGCVCTRQSASKITLLRRHDK